MTTKKKNRQQKILLVDDHSLIREGIKSTIKESPMHVKVLEADRVAKARTAIVKEEPHIVVLDISLPDGNGMDLAEELIHNGSPCKIIMLSMFDDYDYVSRCLEIGVHGYVLKHEGSEIVDAITEVTNDTNYYSTQVRELIINHYTERLKNKNTAARVVNLTKRENEVLKCVVQGMTSLEIADLLFISTRTVDTHRSNIMKKVKVKNSIGLINKAKELKLIG